MLEIYKNKNFKEVLFYNNSLELSEIDVSYH